MNFLEIAVHQHINQYLSSHGMPTLNLDKHISTIARNHSKYMAANRVITHSNFQSRYQSISSIYRTRKIAENVAYNQGHKDPAIGAVKSWVNSQEHHKNIIGGYRVTGIGVFKDSQGCYYFTQLFVK